MSSVLDAIEVKKHGGALGREVIEAVVAGYTSGEIPDYQMSALLMAIRLIGMEAGETLDLTRAMAESGPRYSFPDCVDKHSTGGVGDKVTLCALPLVAACGVPVAKLSGRGLGITGGTIDKLEAIPGFEVALGEERFRSTTSDSRWPRRASSPPPTRRSTRCATSPGPSTRSPSSAPPSSPKRSPRAPATCSTTSRRARARSWAAWKRLGCWPRP